MTRLAVLGLIATLGGCGGEVTEIFACYSVDPAYDGARNTISLTAVTPEGRLLYDSILAPPADGVISQGFVRASADGVVLSLRAAIENQPDPLGGTEPIVLALAQVADVSFQPGRVVDVTLWIEETCAFVTCSVEETCVEGMCTPEAVPQDCLADHGLGAPAGCSDARVTRGCRRADGSP